MAERRRPRGREVPPGTRVAPARVDPTPPGTAAAEEGCASQCQYIQFTGLSAFADKDVLESFRKANPAMAGEYSKTSYREENDRIEMDKKLQEINESRTSNSPGNSNTKYKGLHKKGNTACVALIRGNQIIVGNVGDSRCVLSRNGQAIELSTDQNLSRMNGDLTDKQNEGLSTPEKTMACNPDIHTESVTGDDDFLLIATDCIRHDIESQHVIDFVHQHLKSGGTDLCAISESLIDLFNESGGNSTVILIQFKDGAFDSSKISEFDGDSVLNEIWYEIIVRLPSKMILRCRAVCKQWRNITYSPNFLQQYHSQQKMQLIVPMHYSGNIYSCVHRVLAINFQCPEDEFQTIIRLTSFGKYKDPDEEGEEKNIVSVVHASLDGLLLLTFDKSCYIVNPATRNSSHLQPVDHAEKVLGLYNHTPSGEYRVLYQRSDADDLEGDGPEYDDLESFCILSLGSHHVRSILLPDYVYGRWVFAMEGQPPAVVGNRLFWAPSTFEGQITFFDTDSEVFHWMKSPVEYSTHSIIKVIELKGNLAVSSSRRGGSKVELFMIEDPESESWVRSHIVNLPTEELDRRSESFFVSLDRDIVIECVWRSEDSEEKTPGKLLYCDQYGELEVLCEGYRGTSPVHVLKESVASHAFFNDSDRSPLFEGM
ncbi:hypothetical protein ACQ4PT_021482 [Festuca glaucescens]